MAALITTTGGCKSIVCQACYGASTGDAGSDALAYIAMITGWVPSVQRLIAMGPAAFDELERKIHDDSVMLSVSSPTRCLSVTRPQPRCSLRMHQVMALQSFPSVGIEANSWHSVTRVHTIKVRHQPSPVQPEVLAQTNSFCRD